MTRPYVLLAALVTVSLAAAQGTDTAKDLKLMQGTWEVTFVEAEGKPLPDKEKAVKMKVVIKGEKYTVFLDEQKYTEGVVKLDAAKKPKTMDAHPADGPFKGMVQPGIYAFEGDDMRVVFTKPGADRPTEFKTKEGTEQMLAHYKRIKDGK